MKRELGEHSENHAEVTRFGFWVYLMTDCVLFACLFAAYAVLHNNTFGGVSSHDIFDLSNVMMETFLLLISSFTCGLAMLAVHAEKRNQAMGWLIVTFLLGGTFLQRELQEFSSLIQAGHGFQASGFLSSFFTLVGTHGLHITVGLIWMVALLWQLLRRGIYPKLTTRLTLLSMFWHFLDIIWIFIFTVVYLMGTR